MRDHSIIIWDRNTRQILHILNGHTDNVTCLQSNNKVIISGSKDETVRIWDIESGELLNTLKHKSTVRLLRFNDNIIVALLIDSTIAIYHIKSPKAVKLQKMLNDANGFVLDLSEKYIISNDDNKIKVWNTSDYQFFCGLDGHEGIVRCLHHCNSLTVSGSEDKTIRLWNIERLECLRVLKGHELPVLSLRFDNKRIASGDLSGVIKVWDLSAALDSQSNNVCITTLKENNSILWDIHINPFQIVSFSWDHSIVIWDFSGQ
jgi:F-box and WD-40 domain protein 1/11